MKFRINPLRFPILAGLGIALLIGLLSAVAISASPPAVGSYRFTVGPPPDLGLVIGDLEKRIKRDPTTGMDRAALAAAYVSKAKMTGDEASYETAHALAVRSLELLPVANPQAKMVLAQIASARHQFKESIQLGEEVLREKPSSEVLALMATSYLAQGRLAEAMAYADRMVDEHPILAAYGLRALVLQGSGRDAEAESDYRHGLALETAGDVLESAWTRTLYARFLLKFSRISEAKDLIHEALRIVPAMPLALDQMGELELQRKHFKEAAAFFMQAFTGSRQILYFHHFGKAKQMAGDEATARKVFDECEKSLRAELARNRYGHRAELAQLLLDEGKKEGISEAILLMKEELKSRQSADILKVLALAYVRAENWNDGRKVVQQMLRLGVRDPALYRLASLFQEKLGNPEGGELYAYLARRAGP